MTYKHGIAGVVIPSTDSFPPSGVGTLPVYIGTAPIHQLAHPEAALNVPYLVNSFDEAKERLGYSDDWARFTLCEAMYAHFKNPIQNIGPVVMVNVLDPALHTKDGTESVVLTNGVGFITKAALKDSVVITGKVEGTDYTLTRMVDGTLKLAAVTTLTSPVAVAFDELDSAAVDAADIVGGITNGEYAGIACVDLVYGEFGMVPTILAAPGYGQLATVYEEMAARCQKISGHWDAIFLVDLDDITLTTIDAAKAWKGTKGYTSKFGKDFWPQVKNGDRTYHLSTLAAARMQQTDWANGNCPFESPSNKQIPVTGLVLPGGGTVKFDEAKANTLNAEGITTAIYSGGTWRLWGPHMGNYKYGADIKPEDMFDASIRMMQWLTNGFQENFMSQVDGPLNRRTVERILDDSQVWLNALTAEGKILYGNIEFKSQSNPESAMVEGDFVFDVGTTTTPVGKSLTFAVQWKKTGLSSLFGGE